MYRKPLLYASVCLMKPKLKTKMITKICTCAKCGAKRRGATLSAGNGMWWSGGARRKRLKEMTGWHEVHRQQNRAYAALHCTKHYKIPILHIVKQARKAVH